MNEESRLGELAGALYIVSLARPSLASQPYFPPCAHARMISGWGEGRVWPGFRFSLECQKPVVAYVYIACLVTMARYCFLCTSYSFAKARDRRQLHSASFAPVLNVLFEIATEVLF